MADRITDVFVTTGLPTVTYVKRKQGALESLLKRALDEGGQLCLITGPSKTGKTTLYKEVLLERGEEPLVVSCSKTLDCAQLWRRALEKLDLERTTTRSISRATGGTAELELSGKLGWKWLAEAAGKLKAGGTRQLTESEAREKILAEPNTGTLISALKSLNYTLVIEDFHYLPDHVKIDLFQQWKTFVDEKVSIVVVETSHRGVDIAKGNKDLLGRITHIDVESWSLSDLEEIVAKGFSFLHQVKSSAISKLIAKEAVGLPIVVQQICLEMFTDRNVASVAEIRSVKVKFVTDYVKDCLHKVAKTRYSPLESGYATLVRGPRERARVYKTYELVLSCFSVDPIKFALSRAEIDERIKLLNLTDGELPPPGSIASTLGALRKFQEKRELELLEWRPNETMLYILEPIFLFYVRWRNPPQKETEQLDFFEVILSNLKIGSSKSLMRTVLVSHSVTESLTKAQKS